MQRLDDMVAVMKAVAEPSRLRLLAACAEGELTVSDLTRVVGQSQPRVSRHLKVLCDAGLMERFREGAYAMFRLAAQGTAADLAHRLVATLPVGDETLVLDRARLKAIRDERREAADAFFAANAERWDEIRSLHVPEGEVEAALRRLLPDGGIGQLVDVGTGTGRMLELLGPGAERAVGVDASRQMLAFARANLDRAGLRHCSVRLGDMYQLPLPTGAFDTAIVHMVLHFADQPGAAIAEAARVLKPGGRLVLVDFAAHDMEQLLAAQAHRRAGFEAAEIARWCEAAGIAPGEAVEMPGDPLTVVIWHGDKRRVGSTVITTPTPAPSDEDHPKGATDEAFARTGT